MKYEPKKIGKKPEAIAMILFALSMVTVVLSNAVVGEMQWIFQIVTVLLLGIFIYILVRYSFTSYMYEIKARSKMETLRFEEIPAERLQLFINKKQSRSGYATDFVCTLGEIESITPAKKAGKVKGKRFTYYRNMSGGKNYLLKIKNAPDPILLYLEINDDGKDFLDFINNRI
ncbi:MAG: hypothetical protein IJ389_00260 [Clostridia bacterium]|nr:hypothetical protein [Clostridia bacterium]